MSAASTRRRSTRSAAQVGVQPAIAISPTTARVRTVRIMLSRYSSTICGTGSPNLPALPRRPQTPIEQGALCSPHRDAKLSHPSSIRLRDFHPPHRLWFIGPVQQLLPNGQPVLLEIVAELICRHPVDARATFVAPHLPQRLLRS